MARYEVWLADDAGNRLTLLDNLSSLEYVITPGAEGYCTVNLPYISGATVNDTTKPDRQIHIWRAPDGGGLALQQVYLLQRWTFATDDSGNETLSINGVGLNHLLSRRIVAYYAKSDQALFSSVAADDLMKRLVTDALGADSDTDYDGLTISGRNITSLGFSIQAETSDGDTLDKACAWQQLPSVLRAIQEASRTAGNEVFYDIVPTATSPLTCEFRTYTGQPGNDRTLSGTSPLRFGVEFGNIRNPRLTVDYANVQNYIYAGGEGTESDRAIEEVSDSASIALSQFGRREGFAAETSTDTTAVLQSVGNARLSNYRKLTTFSGEIQDTPQAPYGGSGWKVGDRVTVSYQGFVFNSIIRSGRVFYSENNGETVTGYIESV